MLINVCIHTVLFIFVYVLYTNIFIMIYIKLDLKINQFHVNTLYNTFYFRY